MTISITEVLLLIFDTPKVVLEYTMTGIDSQHFAAFYPLNIDKISTEIITQVSSKETYFEDARYNVATVYFARTHLEFTGGYGEGQATHKLLNCMLQSYDISVISSSDIHPLPPIIFKLIDLPQMETQITQTSFNAHIFYKPSEIWFNGYTFVTPTI